MKKKIEKAIKSGCFYHYTKQKQQRLLQCLQRYYQQLFRYGQLIAPVVGLLSVGTTLSHAQNFTKITTPASPFIHSNVNPDAPFGLSDLTGQPRSSFVDIDGDGDLDVFVGEYDGNINYFENTSTNSSIAAFTLVSSDNAFGLSDVGDHSSPSFADIDGDNFLEAISGNLEGQLVYFESSVLVATQSIQRTDELSVFPVPTNSILHYQSDQLERVTALHLFDLMGRCVHTETNIDGIVDMSALPNGQYIIVIEGLGHPIHRIVQKQ